MVFKTAISYQFPNSDNDIKNRIVVKRAKQFNQLQGAAQPMCSSMHSTWLVRECIADNMEKGKNIYVGFLDIKKALNAHVMMD